MIRVRVIKANKKYKIGDTITLSPNEAFGLLDSGVAVISKDMTAVDYVTKEVKQVKKRGNS